jgi:iron complex outermembrane receptor protein
VIRTARAFLLCITVLSPGLAQQAPLDLTNMSLDDLLQVQVTSVSRKEQSLSETGAAEYVISQEDIRRSGATTVPDVLRLAPGVEVARMDINKYAVSIRGSNDRYANKVLVLIDGRSIYSPFSASVFWDGHDVPLENIDRIEVIRGPGGTAWGANAVNGVINIITKNSKESQGGTVVVGAGSSTYSDTFGQFGGKIGRKGTYRVFGKFFDTGNSSRADGRAAADAWRAPHGGFRSDWDLSPHDSLTIEGDLARAYEGQTISNVDQSAQFDTGSILGRWTHTLKNGSQTSLQVYDDYSSRLDEGLLVVQNTTDVDFQHHLSVGSRQDVVWGLGGRMTMGHFQSGPTIAFLPLQRTDSLGSMFVQDEIRITDALHLTVGSKFEHNSITGFEFEPSVQLVWTPTRKNTFWTSAARAIRQPSATETSIQADLATFPTGSLPGVLKLFGNPNMLAEKLLDFEVGYRTQVAKRLSVDAVAFASLYRDALSQEHRPPYFVPNSGSPYLAFPLVFGNQAYANSYGGELSVNWNATDRWRIASSYSMLNTVTRVNGSMNDPVIGELPGYSPKHQFQVRSLLTLPHRIEWDSSISYIGGLAVGNIPGYARLDSRLGRRLNESVEVSIVGQDLLSPRHAEFPDEYNLNHTLIKRSVFAKLTWRF